MAYKNIIILCSLFFANLAYAQTLPEYDVEKSCKQLVGLGDGIYSSSEEICVKNETEAKARLSGFLQGNTSISPARLECCLKFSRVFNWGRPIIVANNSANPSFGSKELSTSKPLGSYVILEKCLLDNKLCPYVSKGSE